MRQARTDNPWRRGRLAAALRRALPALFLATAPLAGAAAQEAPLLVTYGSEAGTREGDPDFVQSLYLSVPDGLGEPLYLRIFDADTGGDFDLSTGEPTRTRFALHGGDGASAGLGAPRVVGDAPPRPSGGRLVREEIVGEDAGRDGLWRTFAVFRPDAGELVDGRRLFRLDVEGLEGSGGNVYDATLSLRDRRNLAPEGLRIVAVNPTVRVLSADRTTEVRFSIPEGASALEVGNFDAAAAAVALRTPFADVPLTASGQDAWASDTVPIVRPLESDRASLTVTGGTETPNDVTLFLVDQDGVPVPVELPTRDVVLNTRPQPGVAITSLANCVGFAFDASGSFDPDGDRLAFRWEFQDGAVKEGRSVIHEFAGSGIRTGRLVLTDSSGQLANGATTGFEVYPKPRPTAVIAATAVVAVGEEAVFDASGSDAGDFSIRAFRWHFNDGVALEGARASRTFPLPGTYLVTLEATDDSGHACRTGVAQASIVVNGAPVAVAGEEQRVAIGEEVVLDGSASFDRDGAIAAHEWTLGDGTAATGALVRHTYAAPGRYEVRLRVRDDSGASNAGAEDTVRVVVNAPPVADAGPDLSAAIGEVIRFDGTASFDPDGAIARLSWDFGDGSTGLGPSPTYSYAQSGTYEVTLSVVDDSGARNDGAVDTMTVVVNDPPVADAGPDQRVTHSLVVFDGSGSLDRDGRIVSHVWDFGDGAGATGERVEHVFREAGRYLVRLTVTDDSGTVRNVAEDTMVVLVNAAPIADAGRSLVAAPGEEVTLQGDRSLDPDGDIVAFEWTLGDGAEATGPIVTHTYDRPGSYPVALTVRDDTGHPQAFDVDGTTVVVNARPTAVAGPDVRIAPGDELVFDAAASFDSDGEIALSRWDFSDREEPSYAPSLTRSYEAPGIYRAQLTVTDDSGAINAEHADARTIVVNARPAADAGDDVFQASTTVHFDAGGSVDPDGDPLAHTWSFGDGQTASGRRAAHTYAEGGVYPVVLTVDDGTGLSNARDTDEIEVVINRAPVAVAGENRRVCTDDVITFDGSSSFDPDGGVLAHGWDFGDGTGADIVNPTKVYREGGTYPVTLTVRDEAGLSNSIGADRVTVEVDQGPIARAGEDIAACVNTEVHFDGSGSWDVDGVVNAFDWDFGDGGQSGGERPFHIYKAPGIYRALLTIVGEAAGQCDRVSSDEIMVTILEGPEPVIDGPEAVATGAEAVFDAARSAMPDGEIVDYRWDFADGTTARGARVTHTFAEPGAYRVRLTLVTDSPHPTCREVSAFKVVTANAAPVADAGPDREAGVLQSVVFDGTASSDADGGIVSWRWDFGDGATAEGSEVRHAFAEPGIYDVTLTVADTAGVSNSVVRDVARVTVTPAPATPVAAPPSACVGETVDFALADEAERGGVRWLFGDGAEAEGPAAAHAFDRAGHYEVVAVLDDGRGLETSVRQVTHALQVNAPPQALAGPDRLVCPGDVLTFDATRSSDLDDGRIAFRWDFGDGSSAAGAVVEHAFSAPGTYRVRLTATDPAGAACSSGTDEAVVRVNARPVADAGGPLAGVTGGANDFVLLDGSGSSDPDGDPLRFDWSIPADAVALAGERVKHGFLSAGEVAVALTVADGTGLSCGVATDETTATIRRHGGGEVAGEVAAR